MNRELRKQLYLAGPEVFLPESIRQEVLELKLETLARFGLVGLDPMDNNLDLDAVKRPFDKGLAIYRANADMMHRADGALVNLSPFRGPSADAGTVFEVGFMTAAGKPMVGYTLDGRDYMNRVIATAPTLDQHGMLVEDFGQIDNLMIESAVVDSGGEVLRAETESAAGELYDPELFEAAVDAWLRRFG